MLSCSEDDMMVFAHVKAVFCPVGCSVFSDLGK